MSPLWCQLLVVAASLAVSNGARILAVYPAPAWSHWNNFRPLLWELADRGHHITVLLSIEEQQPHHNWTVIPVGPYYETLPAYGLDVFTFGENKVSVMARMVRYGELSCERLMEEEAVQRLLKSQDERFDLFINELFFNDCFLVFAHKFNTPIVGVCPFQGTPWMDDMVGNPWPWATLPNTFLNYESLDSLLDRTLSVAYGVMVNLWRRYIYLPKIDAIVRKHVPDAPSIAELERNTSLVLFNAHVAFNQPRPTLPNIVMFGGMHIKPSKPLSKDLQKFLDDAPHGVIYFSLGTFINADFKPAIKQAFIDTFSRIKQKVLWKIQADAVPVKSDNIMVSNWLPQPDILAHKNVRLFMTHGGINSIQEALYHGVPLIGFPVLGDQHSNMNQAQTIGLGIKIPLSNITVESLSWAIKEILEVPSYREVAQRRSRAFRDNPRPPKEEAAYWIEYVIRHKGATHMRSASLDLTWYQYLLLDIIAFILLVVVSLSMVIVLVVKRLLRLVVQPTSSANGSKKLKQKRDSKKRN